MVASRLKAKLQMATTQLAAPARHSEVIPAFVLHAISRPIEWHGGHIQPIELVRWERASDLTESARRTLREIIIRRTRAKADRLWSQPVGVHLSDGWANRLTSFDRKLVDQMRALRPSTPLENWTLREVKEGLRLPLERTLGILARLEATYWVPPDRNTTKAPPVALFEPGAPLDMSDDIRGLIDEVLGLPWLSSVTPDDLRFAYPSQTVLKDWLAVQRQQGRIPASLPRLLRRLLNADRLTAEAEAAAIAERASTECVPRAGGADAASRWVAMLLRRHLAPAGAGRTLIEVGEDFGVTRERIRQVCLAFEDYFPTRTITTPALDRVLAAAARVAPLEASELDMQLRRFIGEGVGIESLIQWSRVLGHKQPSVECERVRTRVRGQLVEVTMVRRAAQAPWVSAMIRHVSRDSSMFGCTNVLRIAGRLALKEGIAPGQEAIEGALEAAAGFRWLDQETGWFALGDGSTSSAASRVRKIVAVARETVGTDQIAGALASDDMWMYRESTSLGLATPPVHVLRELLLGWTWLKVVQKSRFIAGDTFDATGVLTDAERACVGVIEEHDGVACRFELKDMVLGELGLTDVMLAALLGSSPIFIRLEHGLYAVMGRRMGDAALNSARARLRARSGAGTDPPDLSAHEFVARVTDASLVNEQYSVPARFRERLFGRRMPVLSKEGANLGEVRVTNSGAMSGLNRLFATAAPGSFFRIEVASDYLRVALQAATDRA